LSPDDPFHPDARLSLVAHRTRERHGRRWRRVAGLVLPIAFASTAVLAMPSADAAPKPTVAQVERTVKKLHDQAEQASEDYDTTREQLKSIDVRLKAAGTKITRQEVEVTKAKRQVGMLAAETYRKGQLSSLDVLLSDDPQSALAQAGYLPSLTERRAGALGYLKQIRQDLISTQTLIKQQRTSALAAQKRLAATKKTVKKKLAAATAELNRLEAPQRQAVNNALNSGGNVPAGAGSAFCSAKAVDSPSAAGSAAIKFACAQIGDPYLWAADGPSRWDCSGLTMRAFAAGGVSIPHSSKMQASYGTSVSVSNLQAGDLIFFHSPISHVAIYLGGGLMVHAPHTGSVVQVASLYATPSAAVRL
jgi:cell wall-associated NlpC family hydrolase